MVTVIYCQDGLPVTEWNIDKWVATFLSKKDTDSTFRVSTELPILAVRKAIASDEVSYDDVQFQVGERLIKLNEYGNYPMGWPRELGTCSGYLCEELIRAQMMKRHRIKMEKDLCQILNQGH